MSIIRRRSLVLLALVIDLFVHMQSVYAAECPAWWIVRGVVDTNVVANDYAGVNAGQVKWIAAKACEEFNANLPNGAGQALCALVAGFMNSNNYCAVNTGQLKSLAQAFHDRLIEEGYSDSLPWTATTMDDVNFAMANVGQVKHLFDFDLTADADLDSLADWWERYHFGGLTNQVGTDDWDGDGLSNAAEYSEGTSPIDADSDSDGLADGWEYDHFGGGTNGVPEEDFDGDGHSNLEEYVAGTSPVDAFDVFEAQDVEARAQTSKIVIHWKTVPGRVYTVYSSTNLLSADWPDVLQLVGDGTSKAYTNSASEQQHSFFRIGVKRQ